MKLAAKLTLSLASLAMLALALEAWVEQRRRADLLAMDVMKDWKLARVVQANVETVWREVGPDTAQRLVESTDKAVPHRPIRFVWLRDLPEDLQAELVVKRVREDVVWRYVSDGSGSEMRWMYVPLAPHGVSEAAVAAGESLQPRDAFLRRALMRKAAVGLTVLLLSGLLAVVLGAWLVERPVEMLRQAVRALGDGQPGPPIVLKRRDELADLAKELNAVGERLVARERLQHADRLHTIGQLASGVAHELGTPLSVVGVRARLILSGEATDEETKANAKVILEQAGRMTAIVRQLLDYARRHSLMGLVDVRHVVSGSLGMLEPLAVKQKVRVEFEVADEPLLVRADQTQLQQVVTNVAMNGIQAMADGGTLRVSVGRGRAMPPRQHGGEADEYYWIRVRDEGAGIAPEHLPHVFEPFYTTKAVGEGTGLGLAVVQAIVEEHGGWVTVESEPGRGACFTVFVGPAREEPALRRLAS